MSAFGESCPAGVAVVDEDRGQLGVGVQGGGDAADVPAVEEAISGSSPIIACSAACSAPGTCSGTTPAAARAVSGTVIHTASVCSLDGGSSSGSSESTSELPSAFRWNPTTAEVTSTCPKCSSNRPQVSEEEVSSTSIEVVSRAWV